MRIIQHCFEFKMLTKRKIMEKLSERTLDRAGCFTGCEIVESRMFRAVDTIRDNLAFWKLFGGNSKKENCEKMMRNVEIKARVRDPEKMEGIVYHLTESLGIVVSQEDVFFRVPHGRLKLRIHGGNADGELIFYQRSNVSGPTGSDYWKTVVQDANSLKVMMGNAQKTDLGKEIANDLMKKLEVDETDLIPVAYIDMLLEPSYQEKYGHGEMNGDIPLS